METFYSHGKLLLTGEYLVLDGALSLAIPTKKGQYLEVNRLENNGIINWKSFNDNQELWFKDKFEVQQNTIINLNNNPISKRLAEILNSAKKLNSSFLSSDKGYEVSTHLEFPNNWGLGTSSTLINNIANWAQIDPYQLLEDTFGGSGYDIACADAKEPITYKNNSDKLLQQVKKDNLRDINPVNFEPSFKEHLYFVHLNEKQDSREGIRTYMNNRDGIKTAITEVNRITKALIYCTSLLEFQNLIDQHEQIISGVIKQLPVKEKHFKDFDGSIKSLGAWGGDFVLVASIVDPKPYFKTKGYHTIIDYNAMVLK